MTSISDPTAADPRLGNWHEDRKSTAVVAGSPTQLTLLAVAREDDERAARPVESAQEARPPVAPPGEEQRVDAPLPEAGEEYRARTRRIQTETPPAADHGHDRPAAAKVDLVGVSWHRTQPVAPESSGTSPEEISASPATPADGATAKHAAAPDSAPVSPVNDQAEYRRLSEYVRSAKAGQSELKGAVDRLIELAERLGKQQKDLVALGLPPALVSRRYRLCRLRRHCPEAARLSISRQEELLPLLQPEPELREDAKARRLRLQRLEAIPQIVERILEGRDNRPLSVEDCGALVKRALGHKPEASAQLKAFLRRFGAENTGLPLEQWERMLVELHRLPRSQWPIPVQIGDSKARR